MTKSILIQSGRVIDPSAGTDETADLLVEGGCIRQIGTGMDTGGTDCEVVQAAGLIVAPGLVDPHVHFREPGFTHKETIATGSRAAAAGGFTSVICEPNTDPPIDSPDMIDELTKLADDSAIVHAHTKACITRGAKGAELTDIARIARKERCAALSDDGNPVVSDALMRDACAEAAQANIVVSPHAEDSEVARRAYESAPTHPLHNSQPYCNEAHYVARDIGAGEAAGCRLHISHLSLAESLHLIKRAKAKGRARVTCEVSPHHLALCADDGSELGPDAVMNPPLRGRADMEALCRAVADGVVDCIATDHAPHAAEEKERGTMGVIGLETALGVLMTTLVKPGLVSVPDLIARMASRPAKIFGLTAGTLAVGALADVVLIDPDAEWTVDPTTFQSKSRNCPFAGWQLSGRAVMTIVSGAIAMREGEILDVTPLKSAQEYLC